MTNLWNWLVKSSADPTQVALTAKGLVSSLIPLLMLFVHTPSLSNLPDEIYTLILALFTVYSAGAVLFGLARKVYISFVIPTPPTP